MDEPPETARILRGKRRGIQLGYCGGVGVVSATSGELSCLLRDFVEARLQDRVARARASHLFREVGAGGDCVLHLREVCLEIVSFELMP